MADPTLTVMAPNFPPRLGGIESLLHGLAGHAWPATTVVMAPPSPGSTGWDAAAPYRVQRRALVGRVPPRWWPARQAFRRAERSSDIVLVGEWWPVARAAPARAGQRRPLRLLMVYGTEVVAARGRALQGLQRAVRSMDLVLAISRYTAQRLRERVPDGPPVEILNPGVELDPERADPGELRRRLDIGAGPVVLTAARLIPRKGHREFARAWPEVTRRIPGAQWLVVGDGPCRAELEAAGPPGLRVLGPVDGRTLMGLYRLADVNLLPGLPAREVEGFGMVLTEAGAAGTPSVTVDLGGAAEALGAGGVVVPPGDMVHLARAVADLLEDPTRREELGRWARARAEELSWDKVAGRFRGLVRAHMAAVAP